jgi:hypothetical protein
LELHSNDNVLTRRTARKLEAAWPRAVEERERGDLFFINFREQQFVARLSGGYGGKGKKKEVKTLLFVFYVGQSAAI